MPGSTEPNADIEVQSWDRRTIRGWVSKLVAVVVPASIQTRAVSVDVCTPSTIEQDQPMEFQVTFRNWLPIPLSLQTKARPWYWQLDGIHDADVTEPDPQNPDGVISNNQGKFRLSSFNLKKITRVWNGRIRMESDGPLLPLEPGEHVLEVEVTTTDGRRLHSSQRFRILADEEESLNTNDN